MRIGHWRTQEFWLGRGGQTEMMEPCLPCTHGKIQKVLPRAWDKNGLEANLKTGYIITRGGVEDTRLEAKDTKKIQGQGQLFRGQNLSRPRTGMFEAKDRGHRHKRSPKKKKVFKNIFQAISNSLAYSKVLIKEGLNHMIWRYQNFSKEEVFAGQRYRRMKDLKSLLPVCT